MKYVFKTLNVLAVASSLYLMSSVWERFFALSSFADHVRVFVILAVVFVFSLSAIMIVNHWDTAVTRFLYLLAGLWFGFMLNTILLAAIYFSLIRLFPQLSLTQSYLNIVAIAVPLLLLLPEFLWARQSRFRYRSARIKDLPDFWEGKKIVHVSDVHLGPVWRQKTYDRLVDMINESGAEAVFISGDLFDGMETDFSWFHKKSFNLPLGSFYAFGNHDFILGKDKVKGILEKADIKVLDNKVVEVEGLQIIGLDCYYKGRLDVKGKILSQVGYNPKLPSLLIYHEPKDIKAARSAGIDLQMSGHTHGGQMFPLNLVAQILYRGLARGFHNLDGLNLSVSDGFGTWGPPLRLGSRSELVIITLNKA